jgi:hypothetical protein
MSGMQEQQPPEDRKLDLKLKRPKKAKQVALTPVKS